MPASQLRDKAAQQGPLPSPKLQSTSHPVPGLQLTVAHPVHCCCVTRCEGRQVASPCRLLEALCVLLPGEEA